MPPGKCLLRILPPYWERPVPLPAALQLSTGSSPENTHTHVHQQPPKQPFLSSSLSLWTGQFAYLQPAWVGACTHFSDLDCLSPESSYQRRRGLWSLGRAGGGLWKNALPCSPLAALGTDAKASATLWSQQSRRALGWLARAMKTPLRSSCWGWGGRPAASLSLGEAERKIRALTLLKRGGLCGLWALGTGVPPKPGRPEPGRAVRMWPERCGLDRPQAGSLAEGCRRRARVASFSVIYRLCGNASWASEVAGGLRAPRRDVGAPSSVHSVSLLPRTPEHLRCRALLQASRAKSGKIGRGITFYQGEAGIQQAGRPKTVSNGTGGRQEIQRGWSGNERVSAGLWGRMAVRPQRRRHQPWWQEPGAML